MWVNIEINAFLNSGKVKVEVWVEFGNILLSYWSLSTCQLKFLLFTVYLKIGKKNEKMNFFVKQMLKQ